MFRKLISIICVVVVSLVSLTAKVQAADTGWVIEDFHQDLKLRADSSLAVVETIRVDFKNLEKHGIYRTIPINYKDKFGNKLNIRLKVISVSDEQGQRRQVQIKRKGSNLELKIGDPDLTVSGIQTYVIYYQAQRVLNRFEEYGELYWNVTGTQWPIEINKASANVTLPSQVLKATCFTGPFGSTLQDCQFQSSYNSINFSTTKPLLVNSGLTIVVGIPKDAVKPIPASTKFFWFIADNWPFALPLLTLLILFWLYWLHGRDERFKSLFDPSKGREKLPLFAAELTPTAYAPLKDIKPAEAGTLIDEEVNIRDIAATIIDLAVRGYIKIEEIEKGKINKKKEFTFERTEKDEENLEDFEKKLMTGLFKLGKKTLLSSQKYHFYRHLKKIRSSLYDYMLHQGYFYRRPDKVKDAYRAIGLVIIFLGLSLAVILGSITGQLLAWAVGLAGSGLLCVIFAKAMPKRTAKGRREFLRVMGLRNFVSLGAYREKLWEKANLFEEVLPYAIAFDLTHKWAEAFKVAEIPHPDWYKSSQRFNLYTFSYSLEEFTRMVTVNFPAVRSTSASSASSGFSGGGFSGGGFGGGGGGSW